MKHLKHLLLIGLLSVLITPQLFAQNIDANRLNRDIRIMENILAELFRTQTEIATAETITFERGNLRQRGIRGTYLNDFGLIFMIPADDPFSPGLRVQRSGNTFYYNSNSESENAKPKIDETEIKSRVAEFLLEYASTIGQLADENKIMVIHGAKSGSNRTVWNYRVSVNGTVVDEKDSESLPVISASISMKDLRDYRSGRLDEAKVKQRITFANSEGKEYMDLKVMGNIFETALRNETEESFRMSGGISFLMLDNYGAIFSFDARYGGGRNILFGRLVDTQRRLRMDPTQSGRRDEDRAQDAETLENEAAKLKENISTAYASLKTNVTEYMVDYGRTLSSVNTDQFILTSVNVSSAGIEGIPERVDFQIKKSVLEQLDRGKISREEALNSVSITEY